MEDANLDDLFDHVDKWGEDILSLLPNPVDGSPVPSQLSHPSSTSAGCTTATASGSDSESGSGSGSGMDGAGTPTLAAYAFDIPHVEPMSTENPLEDLDIGVPTYSSATDTPIAVTSTPVIMPAPVGSTVPTATALAPAAAVAPAAFPVGLAPAPVPALPVTTTTTANNNNTLKRPNTTVLPSVPDPERIVASFVPAGGASSKRLKREERLRRNRESAQRSRQRARAKAQVMDREMTELRNANAAKDATIAGLQAENKALREQVEYLRSMAGGVQRVAPASSGPSAMTGGIIAMTLFFSFAVCFMPGSPAAGGLSQWFSGGAAMMGPTGAGDVMPGGGAGLGRRGLLTEDARSLETPPTLATEADAQGLPPVPHFWSPSAAVSFALYALGMHQMARTVLTHIACVLGTVLTIYFARQSVKSSGVLSRVSASGVSSSSGSSSSSGQLLPVSKTPRPVADVLAE